MRHVLAVLVTLAMSAMVLLGDAPPAHGCSCIESRIVDAVTPETVAAFIGAPISSRDVGYPEGQGWHEPVRWTFEVETVIAGDVPAAVEVGSGYGGGDCGVDFSSMDRVGIVAYDDDMGLATGICGGVWNADELLEAYGPGYAPLPVEGQDNTSSLWALVIAALVVGGSVLYATRPLRPSPSDA